MDDILGPTGRAHKSRGRVSDQAKRREIALQRQRASRRDLQNHARKLAQLSTNPTDDSDSLHLPDSHGLLNAQTEPQNRDNCNSATASLTGDAAIVNIVNGSHFDHITAENDHLMADSGSGEITTREIGHVDAAEAGMSANLTGSNAREWYSKQLMIPEWMVDIPSNLDTEWYVMPRPDGIHCLVVSCNGMTVSRLPNGRILHRFPSSLPNGARTRHVAAPSHIYCILDCVFHEADETYYILDVMCWKGYSLYNCSSEFRLFWVHSKLQETGASDPPSHFHKYTFKSVPTFEGTVSGLKSAYLGKYSFARDGLLFYNKQAEYIPGVTPLVLRWKDSSCSQYVIDTDNSGAVLPRQMVVLELQKDGQLVTSDSPPTPLGSMPADFVQNNSIYWREGILLRFSVGDGGVQASDGIVRLTDLIYEGLAKRRGRSGDSLSKILFQHAVRTNPITISDLVSSGAVSESDMAVDLPHVVE